MSALTVAILNAAANPVQAQTADLHPDLAAPAAPAVASLNPDALLRLGDLYSSSSSVEPDFSKALKFYKMAAAAGSDAGAIKAGEMTAIGLGTEADTERGRRSVATIAEKGNVTALVILGDMYARGNAGPMTPRLALANYQKAAASGSVAAMLKLGDLYRSGRFEPANIRKAGEYYARAAATGDGYALLAWGNFLTGYRHNRGTRDANGMDLLRKAKAKGVEEAAVGISGAYLYGLGVPRNVSKALDMLKKEADGGNAQAALALISIYRDGRQDGRKRLVQSDADLARSLLRKYRDLMTPGTVREQILLMDVSDASEDLLDELYVRLRALPKAQQSETFRQLPHVNTLAYIYFAQLRLKELGVLKGEPDGRPNAATKRAFKDICLKIGVSHFCKAGPMSDNQAEMVSYVF